MPEQDNPLKEMSKENLINLLDGFTVPQSNPQNLTQENRDLFKVARDEIIDTLKSRYQLDNQGIEAGLQRYRGTIK